MLKNHTQNAVEKLFPDPFLKNQNWVYLWIISLKFYEVFFYWMLILGLSKYIETKLPTTCFLPYTFLKKRGLELVFLSHFLHDFRSKIFFLLYSITWPNFIVWLPLICDILSNMCIIIVYWPGCEPINFEVNLIFLIELFVVHDQKVKTKV